MAEHLESQWYAIVDTAQHDELYDYVQTCAEQQCLISGTVPRELATALPYLVKLGKGEPLTEAWQQGRLCANWGISFKSRATIDNLRIHFKRFLTAKLPDGTVVLFRFYDPRVLFKYLTVDLQSNDLSSTVILKPLSFGRYQIFNDFIKTNIS